MGQALLQQQAFLSLALPASSFQHIISCVIAECLLLQQVLMTVPSLLSSQHGMHAQVECVEVPWGCGADEAKLEQILKADTDKKVKAVAVVHNETTTGVTSDIKQVRQVGPYVIILCSARLAVF